MAIVEITIKLATMATIIVVLVAINSEGSTSEKAIYSNKFMHFINMVYNQWYLLTHK
jgi:hypothetical protein